jgi:hypothetical protein
LLLGATPALPLHLGLIHKRRGRDARKLVSRKLHSLDPIRPELVISEHTAATHVRKNLKKLRLQAFGQIGSWLAQQRSFSTDPD